MSQVELAERVRELERSLEELRSRHVFLLALERALQSLVAPRDIMQTTARMVSEYLKVDRCAYASVEEERIFDITGDWACGVPSIVGRWEVAAFGPDCVAHMFDGTPFVVEDAETDPRLSPVHRAAYRTTTIRAVICVPLQKQGILTAAMAVHQQTPRRWTSEEIELVTTVVFRCWETLERAAVMRTRNAAELALADSAARLDYAVRLSGIGFWYCDLPFAELLWDERVKSHFWLPPNARVTIELFYERIHPADRDRTRAAIDASIANHGYYDIIYRTVDPGTHAIKHIRALGGTAYADDGNPVRFDGVTLDVTELRESDRRKDEFLAMLAHELRNPLAPIQSGLELIDSATDPVVAAKTVAVMKRNARHVVRIVDDLLDISRITLGKVELVRSRTDARSVVESALEISRGTIEEAGHQLTVDLAAGSFPLVVDATRITQVLSNLLTNAAKYTPSGGRIEIRVDHAGEPDRVRIRVADNGIGIPEDQLASVFDMFTQLKPATERSQGGLGIGLTLARRLVEMHGGTLVAASEGVGAGSTFTVELPLAASTENEATVPPAAMPRARRLRILVVDDNIDAAEMLGFVLEADGHEVRLASTGRDAVSAAGEFSPELVLLDLGLPDIEGDEVARRLRANPTLEQPHLVALTGWGDEAHRRKTADAGFDDHVVKPVDRARLDSILARVTATVSDSDAP